MKIKKKKVKRDLFMCMTSLQMLIARRIIESPSYDGEKPDLVLVALSTSDKYSHYAEEISPYCRRCIKLKKLIFPFNLYYIVRYFIWSRYNRIYLASIDSSFYQLLISYLRFDEINTFDDGTANISKSSAYYHDPKSPMFNAKRVAFRLAGNRYSRKRLIELSKAHHTIYPSFDNISKIIRHVDLIGNVEVEAVSQPRPVTIILGTCYRQVVKSPDLEDKLINEFVNYVIGLKNERIYYIAHPRDERNLLPGIDQINDKRISEEIIADFIKSGHQATLIGFASSVQFAFLSNKKVENISLISPNLKDIVNELSEKLSRHGGKVSKL